MSETEGDSKRNVEVLGPSERDNRSQRRDDQGEFQPTQFPLVYNHTSI